MELKIGNCRIVLDFGFPAMVVLLFLWSEETLLLQTLAVCMLHETGHGLVMWLSHAGVREIRLYAAGMQMRTHTVLLSRAQRLAIYLSGPAINLLFAALLAGARPETALLHLCMGLFNLLPFRILDGGAALRCLWEDRGQRGLGVFCMLLAAGAVVLLTVRRVRNPALYGMAVYLGVSELELPVLERK